MVFLCWCADAANVSLIVLLAKKGQSRPGYNAGPYAQSRTCEYFKVCSLKVQEEFKWNTLPVCVEIRNWFASSKARMKKVGRG